MVYSVYSPGFPLGQFVESFVYYRDYTPDHALDRFLPDGNINLVIDLTDRPKFIHDNNSLKPVQTCRRAWFSGLRNIPITIPSGMDSEMFIVNFHKGMAYPFVNGPLDELTDLVVDGEQVMSSALLYFRDQLMEASDPVQMFRIAERQLASMTRSRLIDCPFVSYSVNHIIQNPARTVMDELSRKVGYSQKHMISLFRRHVGVTPKSFLRIIRFQKVVEEIEADQLLDWSTVTHQCGYFDQSHFISDFKHFSGFTPGEYLVRQRDFRNYVAVG